MLRFEHSNLVFKVLNMRHGTILVVRVKLGSHIYCLYCTHYGILIDAILFVVIQLYSDRVWVLNYVLEVLLYKVSCIIWLKVLCCDVIFRIMS